MPDLAGAHGLACAGDDVVAAYNRAVLVGGDWSGIAAAAEGDLAVLAVPGLPTAPLPLGRTLEHGVRVPVTVAGRA